ncbi:CpaF family protein [Streptomyces sp. N35]|uniref:CpaF family protein n=1 Tax=Streptomyces sp. N35 TaxID=2795730 RepID=UPI0018F4BB7D|nr:CpaF/VirB11 family protein [Streptomyces sp. N35]
MRGEPLHPTPYQVPQPPHTPHYNGNGYSASQPQPPAAGAAHAGAGAMVNGAALPQVQIDTARAEVIKRLVNDQLIKEGKNLPAGQGRTEQMRRQRARALINEHVEYWADEVTAAGRAAGTSAKQALAELVFDMLFRAGRLQRYLDDDRIEDIWIYSASKVFVKYGDTKDPVQVDSVADSEEQLQELVRDLIRTSNQSGKQFSSHRPEVALRLADGSRLQAMGPEITGEHTHVTIRRHRIQDAILDDLIKLGTMDGLLADFLAACVRARRNIMIVGEQGAGKTSLLRALLKEFGPNERFGTLETEFELWAHKNGYHQHVVPMEARESNGELVDGKSAGEITLMDLLYRAKRMSLTRIVVGEVRGPEITALMQALTGDRPGNLCTMHASEPEAVFDRIAEMYLMARENFSPELAYRQIANGLHFIVFLSVDESGPVKKRFVSHVLEITGIGEGGRPAYNEVFRPAAEWDLRAQPYAQVSQKNRRKLEEAGFTTVLQPAVAAWPPQEVRA